MRDWQLKEYNELRLEKIEQEHRKYMDNRVLYIIEKLFFENVVEQPQLSGYSLLLGRVEEKRGKCLVDLEYTCNHGWGDQSEELSFPLEWLYLKEQDVYSRIVAAQVEEYNEKLRIKETQDEVKKAREIQELEAKLLRLKG